MKITLIVAIIGMILTGGLIFFLSAGWGAFFTTILLGPIFGLCLMAAILVGLLWYAKKNVDSWIGKAVSNLE